MSDDIPDPTLLRKKLGIGPKTVVRPTIHDFAESRQTPELQKLGVTHGKGITLADFESEPREIDEAESAKISEILKGCPPPCARWLKRYIVLGNRSAASRAINYSAAIGSYWRKQYPEFRLLLEFYEEEVRERWNELAERRATEGFKEEVFKPDGSLKHTKMRQDPHFMKELMRKMDVEWRDSDSGTNITINVVRSEE